MSSHPEKPRGTESVRHSDWGLLALVLLGGAFLHSAAVPKPFFADDYLFLEQVRGRSFLGALLAPDPLGNFLRPVSRAAYFWLIGHLGGESPPAFHLVNLGAFLASLALFHAIARRWLNRTAALAAVVFVAFHYAADVPLRWASGSQDLLAVLFALCTVHLQGRGRIGWAALTLVLALLSKESVAGAAIVGAVLAMAAASDRGAELRRQAPLLVLTALWGVASFLWLHHRPAGTTPLSFDATSVPAGLVHLAQVALGLEARMGGEMFGHWSIAILAPPALALVVLVLSARSNPAESDSGSPRSWRDAAAVGGVWAAAGLLPILLVMPIWSAYFFLWPLFGIGLVVGAAFSAIPSRWALALPVTLVLLSSGASRLDEFASHPGAWTMQSHVNRHYVERSLDTIGRFLGEMRAARPTLPHRSTIFFADVPVSAGWQTADGPLVRWAYRDSSLRSYFLGQFTRERARRGPDYFFVVENDQLKDRTGDPQVLHSFAFSMLLSEHPQAAIDALDEAESRSGDLGEFRYWRAWARLAVGDTSGAAVDLRAGGVRPVGTSAAARDTSAMTIQDEKERLTALRRVRDVAGLDPWVHARLAAALLSTGNDVDGTVEAYAYRVLAPEEPEAWRKWASAQLAKQQYEPALTSLSRYLEIGGAAAQNDAEVQKVVSSLRRIVQGDIANNLLHKIH